MQIQMINRVILIGNIGSDPDVKRLESGATVASFSLATNENYKDKQGEWQTVTEWHDIVCWRQLAEKAETSLSKGVQVYVEGKLTHRSYEDKEGNKRRKTEVVANYFRVMSKKENGQGLPAEPMSSVQASEPVVAGEVDDSLPF